MMLRLVDAKTYREAEASGEASQLQDLGVMKGDSAVVKAIDTEARTIDFIISNESIDRDLDSIKLSGWQLKNFRQNPVVLFAHDHRSPPIAQAPKVWKSDGNLLSKAQYVSREVYPFADMIFQLYAGRFMRAASVGAIPHDWEWITEAADSGDEIRTGGWRYLKTELVEWSNVPVGSNRDALSVARSVGIDTQPMRAWAEGVLDTWRAGDGYRIETGLSLGRRAVEGLHRSSDPAQRKLFTIAAADQASLLKRNLAHIQRQAAAVQAAAELQEEDPMSVTVTRSEDGSSVGIVFTPDDGEVIDVESLVTEVVEASADPNEPEAVSDETEAKKAVREAQEAEDNEMAATLLAAEAAATQKAADEAAEAERVATKAAEEASAAASSDDDPDLSAIEAASAVAIELRDKYPDCTVEVTCNANGSVAVKVEGVTKTASTTKPKATDSGDDQIELSDEDIVRIAGEVIGEKIGSLTGALPA